MALFENKKQLIMIIGAVAIGVVASVMVAGYVKNQINEETTRLALQYEKSQQQKEQQYNEQMAALNQKIIEVEQNARQAAEDAARAAAQAAQQAVAQQGAGVAVPGEEVKKRSPSLALKTPPGKRAVTVKIESLGAVGGLVSPGDFVDVIAHLDVPSRVKKAKDTDKDTKETVTAMIFQKLQILAVNVNLDQPGTYEEQQKEGELKITFAVNPQEASLLSYAEKNGKLELALRGPNESKSVMLSAATWSTLAEYVLENNGADLKDPDGKEAEEAASSAADVEVKDVEEVTPYIQIYRGGREL